MKTIDWEKVRKLWRREAVRFAKKSYPEGCDEEHCYDQCGETCLFCQQVEKYMRAMEDHADVVDIPKSCYRESSRPRRPMMNVKLLRKVKRHILEEPRRFLMGNYQVAGPELSSLLPKKLIPPCGTAACIAGWAVLLGCEKGTPVGPSAAAAVLGLDFRQSSRLFTTNEWPDAIYSGMNAVFDEFTPKKRARLAAERIEHFIKTKGKE